MLNNRMRGTLESARCRAPARCRTDRDVRAWPRVRRWPTTAPRGNAAAARTRRWRARPTRRSRACSNLAQASAASEERRRRRCAWPRSRRSRRAATPRPRRCCCRLAGEEAPRQLRRARRERPRRGAASLARGCAVAAANGRSHRAAVRRPEPGQHPAARRARAGDHLRPDGRDQHGARRADHDRRLRHLRGAEPVPCATRRAPFDWYLLAAVPAAFFAVGAASAWSLERSGDPLPLRPAAGNAARHLGHQPDPDPGGAHDVRRAERAGGEPGVDVRRRAGRCANLVLPWNRIIIIGFRARGAAADVVAAHAHAARPVRARA